MKSPFDTTTGATTFFAYVASVILSGMHSALFQIICLVVSGCFGILASCAAALLKHWLEQRKKEKAKVEYFSPQTVKIPVGRETKPLTAVDDMFEQSKREERQHVIDELESYLKKNQTPELQKAREEFEKFKADMSKADTQAD